MRHVKIRSMPQITLHSASEFSLTELNQIFMEGFRNYLVPIPDSLPMFAQRIRAEHIDLQESLVAKVDGVPAGLSLSARRYHMTRLAGLGVAVAYRKAGVGQCLTEGFMQPALERGDLMVLECFQANIQALQLYHKNGFEIRGNLVGCSGTVSPLRDPDLTQISLAEAVHFIREHAEDHLPWQVHPDSLISLPVTVRAYRLQNSVAILSGTQDTIYLRSLVTARSSRRQHQATRLLQALAAHTGQAKFHAVQIFPEQLIAPLATALGWTATDLPQFEMVRHPS